MLVSCDVHVIKKGIRKDEAVCFSKKVLTVAK
jgi:hypothetical protein